MENWRKKWLHRISSSLLGARPNKETELLVNDVSSRISRAISSFLPFFLHICSPSLFGSTPRIKALNLCQMLGTQVSDTDLAFRGLTAKSSLAVTHFPLPLVSDRPLIIFGMPP